MKHTSGKNVREILNQELLSLISTKNAEQLTTISAEYQHNGKNTIFLTAITEILIEDWMNRSFYRYSQGKTLDEIFSNLGKFVAGYEENRLTIEARHVATLPPETKEEFLKCIEKLRRRKDLINRIIDFSKRKEELERKANEFGKSIDRVVHLIEDERYFRVCDCCPR